MERRNFLRAMLGIAAATALPSEVFPFRKIFLPAAPTIVTPQVINEAAVAAIELEIFKKGIPDLIYANTAIYERFKSLRRTSVHVPVGIHIWRGPAHDYFQKP
jgi:hypothetical protein